MVSYKFIQSLWSGLTIYLDLLTYPSLLSTLDPILISLAWTVDFPVYSCASTIAFKEQLEHVGRGTTEY